MGRKDRASRPRRQMDNKTVVVALLECLKYVQGFSCAIDGGAHDGFVTKWMEKRFDAVYAFEPGRIFEELSGVTFKPGVRLINKALGDKTGQVEFRDLYATIPRSSHIKREKRGERSRNDGTVYQVPLVTIDSFNLKPDFIKLDLEGYDTLAILGAEETIRKYHPVILVEVKHHRKYDSEAPHAVLKSWGYKEVADIRPDKIMVYGELDERD